MSTMINNVKNTVMQAVTNKKFIMIIVLLALLFFVLSMCAFIKRKHRWHILSCAMYVCVY